MRLIDADKADACEIPVNFDYIEPDDIQEWIDEQPTIDPVHAAGVCYCRECKYYCTLRSPALCKRFGLILPRPMPKDGFCSYGERRKGEGHE